MSNITKYVSILTKRNRKVYGFKTWDKKMINALAVKLNKTYYYCLLYYKWISIIFVRHIKMEKKSVSLWCFITNRSANVRIPMQSWEQANREKKYNSETLYSTNSQIWFTHFWRGGGLWKIMGLTCRIMIESSPF